MLYPYRFPLNNSCESHLIMNLYALNCYIFSTQKKKKMQNPILTNEPQWNSCECKRQGTLIKYEVDQNLLLGPTLLTALSAHVVLWWSDHSRFSKICRHAYQPMVVTMWTHLSGPHYVQVVFFRALSYGGLSQTILCFHCNFFL